MPSSTGPIDVIRLAAMAPKPIPKDPSFHKMLASLAQTLWSASLSLEDSAAARFVSGFGGGWRWAAGVSGGSH